MRTILSVLWVMIGLQFRAHAANPVTVIDMTQLPAVTNSTTLEDLFMMYDVDKTSANTRKLTMGQLGDSMLSLGIVGRGVAVAPGSNVTINTNLVGWTMVYTVNSTGGSGSTALSNLTDVDVTGVVSGNALVYNGTDWVPGSPADIGAIASTNGTGFNTTLVDPTVTGLDVSRLDGQEFLPILGDSNGNVDNTVAGPIKFVGKLREMNQVSNNLHIINNSISGSTLQAQLSDFDEKFAFLTNYPNIKKRWGIQVARNDLASGRTLSQMTNDAMSLRSKMLAFSNTTHVYISTIGGTAGIDLPTKTNYNNWARIEATNGTFQGVWEFDLADPYLSSDGVHYTPWGQLFMATNIVTTSLTNLLADEPILRPGFSLRGNVTIKPFADNDAALNVVGQVVIDNGGNASFVLKNGTNVFLITSPSGINSGAPWFHDNYALTFRGGANSSGTPTNRLNISHHAVGVPFIQAVSTPLQLWSGGLNVGGFVLSGGNWLGTNAGTTIRLGSEASPQYAVSASGTYNPAPDYYRQSYGPTWQDASSNNVFSLAYDGTKLQLSSSGGTPFGIYNYSGSRTNIEGDGTGLTRMMLSTNAVFATNGTVRSIFGVDSAGQVVETAVPTGGGGSATNAIGSTFTNNVAVGTGQTELGMTNGTGTTVSGYTTGARTIYSVNVSTALANLDNGNGGALTNLGNGSTVSVTSGATVATNSNPNGSSNYALTIAAKGNNFVFWSTNLTGTNLILDAGSYASIELPALTNTLFVNHMTNRPGNVYFAATASNANQTIYLPVSWRPTSPTNGMTKGATWWSFTLTNGQTFAGSFTGLQAAQPATVNFTRGLTP